MTSRRPVSSSASPSSGPIALLFGLSGALALIYEVVWQRQFALVFGSAAPATAAILGAYFAGLGVGSWLIGRRAQRWARPLRVYAWLELSIGLGALLVSPFLAAFESIYPSLFHFFSGQAGVFLAIRTLFAFGALLIPTFCMGGTLPLLGQMVDRGRKQLGLTAGWLYVANTLGAALGALAVPFFLLPHFGLNRTVWGSAGVNTALAFWAWALDHRSASAWAPVAFEGKKKKSGKSPASSIVVHRSIGTLALVSGAVTFSLQVLWNRAFAQIHENSMYSFAIIVAVVITALALGAQVARVGLRQGISPHRLIGGTWILAGLFVLCSPWLFLRFSDDLAYLAMGEGWNNHALHLAGLAIALVLVPMTLLGVGLPSIMEQAGQASDGDTGRALGRVLAVNVLGSVLGSLVSGFLLPHWLGLWSGMLWVGVLLLAMGIWQWPAEIAGRRNNLFGSILAFFWLISALPLSHIALPRVKLATDQSEYLLALTEGAHGITAVVERPGSRRLKLNNHYGLGGTASTGDERMQAHIPLLLHPAPHRVAFLGLGTGITAGGALYHPVEQVTVMELVPEVVTAAQDYFRDANRGVIENVRTRVVADDARHSLRSSDARYDVIVGDLVVPWRQGEGSLFTLEQFTAARGALAPNGIFCQWLPLFQLSETEVNILIRTFLQVFPQAQVWRGDFSPTEPAIALIGSNAELKLDDGLMRRRLAEMKADPTNPQLEMPENFWMNYVGTLDLADLSTAERRVNLDDRPWVEMLGPLLHSGGESEALFTGRRLQAWLNHIAQRSTFRLAALPANEVSAVDAGRALAEMTLCLYEDNRAGAKAAQEEMRRLLPPAAFKRLF